MTNPPADAKCQSFSYNAQKHDCLISESAIRFNPQWNYYSRMPWLHKKHIDDDDGSILQLPGRNLVNLSVVAGESFGTTLGRYSVFTGLLS